MNASFSVPFSSYENKIILFYKYSLLDKYRKGDGWQKHVKFNIDASLLQITIAGCPDIFALIP